MSRPDLSRFLARALDPAPRNRLRDVDYRALAEVAASEECPREDRPPADLPHWDRWTEDLRPHYSTLLTEPLDVEAVAERLEVWALIGRKTELRSTHRVSPKKLFGLSYSQFPTEYQVEYARSETLRIAQRAGWDALLDGASRVEIRSYRRKAPSGRRDTGIVIHGLVGVLKSVHDSLIDGEPQPESIEAD